MSLFKKFAAGLEKTRKSILEGVDNALGVFVKVDEELFEELEEALILADIGVETSVYIIDKLRRQVKSENITDAQGVKEALKNEISNLLLENTKEFTLSTPAVVLVVGVNGVGKTTSIGKLTHYFKRQNKKVVLAAADTFRAAAIDQLEVWGQRNDVDVIKHQENSDPSAVVFDGIKAARARNADVLIADTAGRLHNKKNLMEELKKISKVINREYPQASIEVLLVLDANTGQNALLQARAFKDMAQVTGIVLTKLDSTAKGGVVIGIKHQMDLPIYFVGLGEGIEDLEVFSAEEFAAGLWE